MEEEEGSFSSRSLERQSSIDTEPKTLNYQQFQRARESALRILNCLSLDEALRAFTESVGEPPRNNRKRNATAMEQSDRKLKLPRQSSSSSAAGSS